MACATLKRSLDFDPVHNHVNPTKRQRCAPMVISPSSSPPGSRSENYNSVFAGVCPKMSPGMCHSHIAFLFSVPKMPEIIPSNTTNGIIFRDFRASLERLSSSFILTQFQNFHSWAVIRFVSDSKYVTNNKCTSA